jgi:recombination protein RecR
VEIPSRLIERAVDQMASLPGVGRRTALRLVLHMLRRTDDDVRRFAESLVAMREGVRGCEICGNLSEDSICNICSAPGREEHVVAVVEDLRDLLAIEGTGHFRGRYHVLGGVISPMDGVGPGDLRIDDLVARVAAGDIKEIIFALPTTMEGDTTAFYLNKRFSGAGAGPDAESEVRVTSIARGVAVGDEIQYADDLTLIRSFQQRTPYQA